MRVYLKKLFRKSHRKNQQYYCGSKHELAQRIYPVAAYHKLSELLFHLPSPLCLVLPTSSLKHSKKSIHFIESL